MPATAAGHGWNEDTNCDVHEETRNIMKRKFKMSKNKSVS